MDDHAVSHRYSVVNDYLRGEAVTTQPRPACSQDFKHIEHTWDIYGARVDT